VGNKPLRWIDSLGYKPGDRYPSADAAAIQAIRDINPTSIKEAVEYAGRIYRNPDDTYSYTEPRRGSRKRSHPGSCPAGTSPAGDYHTHGELEHYYDEDFSDDDMKGNDKCGLPGYLGTPTGKIKKYTPVPGKPLGGKVDTIETGAK
jgi:hypothetical protein